MLWGFWHFHRPYLSSAAGLLTMRGRLDCFAHYELLSKIASVQTCIHVFNAMKCAMVESHSLVQSDKLLTVNCWIYFWYYVTEWHRYAVNVYLIYWVDESGGYDLDFPRFSAGGIPLHPSGPQDTTSPNDLTIHKAVFRPLDVSIRRKPCQPRNVVQIFCEMNYILNILSAQNSF